MITKLRLKIVAVTLGLIMAIVLTVASIMLFNVRRTVNMDAEAALTQMIDDIEVTQTEDGNVVFAMVPRNFDSNKDARIRGVLDTRSFCAVVNHHEASYEIIRKSEYFSDEEIDVLIKRVYTCEDDKGRVDDLYFQTKTEGDYTIVAITDCTIENTMYTKIFLTIVFAGIGGFVILFFIVWILSDYATRPVKKALQQQKQFISDASHELKTPLTIIAANTAVLKDTLKDNEWLNNIGSQSERMQSLVQEMLMLTRLDEDNKSGDTTKFSLTDVTKEVVFPFDAIAFENGIIINSEIGADLYAHTSESDYRKVVGILVENAVKYADKGEVIVSLKSTQSGVVFSVYNNGCGIKNDERQRVFERFYRSDCSRARKNGGSGLGLAIAKEISDIHKWNLTLDSEESEYTKFYFTIKQSERNKN